MFRVEYLKLINHPQLGNIELFLSDIEEIKNITKPYTSVIIGPNGTGKSFILRTISDILTQFNFFHTSGVRNLSLPFNFRLRYQIDNDSFEIVNMKEILQGKKSTRIYDFYKNKPFTKVEKLFDSHDEYKIQLNELQFPNKLIVSSILQTDRFLFKNSRPEDFYQYLGSRSTSSTSSTKSSSRKTIKYLFNAFSSDNQFKQNIKELLSFLDFEENLKVSYSTKINKLFFTGHLTAGNFKRYFEEWWHEDFTYSTRKKENPLWSIPYYNNNFKINEELLSRTVDYLNTISKKLIHKPRSSSKMILIDLFDTELTEFEFEIIKHLEQLDIINLDGIKINKNNSTLSLSDVSSGEFHLIISMIGIFSKIEDNSIILIDEPEISLHPNWQMQYITFLKKVFSKCASCHFVITSHSHFIVSDLEGESSSITTLNRDAEYNLKSNLIDLNTYGWSAEDILYNVFNVRSTWNYFLEADLTELLGLISNNSKDSSKIEKLINKIEKLPIRKNDPLQEIIAEANYYLKNI